MAQTKTNTRKAAPEPVKPVQALAPTRMPIAPRVGEEYGVTPLQWRVLVEQIFPSARSVEAVMMALEYCKARNLDIFKKPVHIVPMWSSAKNAYVETVWPGVAEIRTTAHRTKQYAGMDPMVYGPERTVEFEGEVKIDGVWKKQTREVTFYEWIDCTVYRLVDHTRVPFTLRTFWEEAYATIGRDALPNDMWCKRPKGQHMKVAEVAVLRMAFPEELGNEYAAEEMEGKVIETAAVREQPAISAPKTLAEAKAVTKDPALPPAYEKEDAVDAEVVDEQPQTDLDKFEAAITAATTIEQVNEIWENGTGFDWGAMSDDEVDTARQLRKGRIAELERGTTSEEQSHENPE